MAQSHEISRERTSERMGGKKRKRQPGGGETSTRATLSATLETPAGQGGKYGNPALSAQNSVAAAQANSIELPNPDLRLGRTPTVEPSHFSPRNDPSASSSVEPEDVAKNRDRNLNSGGEDRQPAPAPAEPPAKTGFFKRLFGGAPKSAESGQGEEDERTGPMITLFTGRVKPLPAAPERPEPPRAETPKPAAAKPEAARMEPPVPAPKTAPAPSAKPSPLTEDTLHKLGELERLREENAALRKKMEVERQVAQKQLGQLEMQNSEFRSVAEKARGEKGDVEARTAVLRKSVSALERQVGEERDRYTRELEQAAKQRDTLLQDIAELNEKIVKLEAEVEHLTASTARSTSTGLSTEIGASHAHISRLESLVQRLEDEVELLQRELATEKEKSRRTHDEWEEKLRATEKAVQAAQSQKSRVADSAGMVQAAMEALELQVREQHEAMEVQMKLLESERAESRSKSANYEQQLKALQAQLEAEQSRNSGEEETNATLTKMETALTETRTHSAQAEARIALLEGELEAARQQVLREAEASAARMRKFEERWKEIQQQLLPKEEELKALRPQVEEWKAKAVALEAELKSAKAAVARLAASAEGDGSVKTALPAGDPTFAQAGVRLPAEVAEPFYHQSMAPITVMLACADILAMSKKLDPSLQGTAAEFKTQTQALLELIKSYTLPPDAKTN